MIGQPTTDDDYVVLLYLTMRLFTSIKQIQNLRAYHTGDKLHIDVAIALDEETILKDSHALAASLRHFLDVVPKVKRAHVWAKPFRARCSGTVCSPVKTEELRDISLASSYATHQSIKDQCPIPSYAVGGSWEPRRTKNFSHNSQSRSPDVLWTASLKRWYGLIELWIYVIDCGFYCTLNSVVPNTNKDLKRDFVPIISTIQPSSGLGTQLPTGFGRWGLVDNPETQLYL